MHLTSGLFDGDGVFAQGSEAEALLQRIMKKGEERAIELITGFATEQPFDLEALRAAATNNSTVTATGPQSGTVYGFELMRNSLTECRVHALHIVSGDEDVREKNLRKMTLVRSTTGTLEVLPGWRD